METATVTNTALTTETPQLFEPYVCIKTSTTVNFKVHICVPYPAGYTPGIATSTPNPTADNEWTIEVPFTASSSKSTQYYGCVFELELTDTTATATITVHTTGGTTEGTTILMYEDADGDGDIQGRWHHVNNG